MDSHPDRLAELERTVAELERRLEAKTAEHDDALAQQAALAEILAAIGNSVDDAQPVFEKILASVENLFGADERAVFLAGEDGLLHVGAIHGPNTERARMAYPMPLQGTAAAIAFRERRAVSFADVYNDPGVPEGMREAARRVGRNFSVVAAPMFWEGRGVGAIMVARYSMKPFTEKEGALLQSFADQAVIAIQNARLFRETQEALERQTATAEILGIIASSPGDPQPVFDAIVESARRLLAGHSATILRFDGGLSYLQAMTSVDAAADAAARATFPRPVPDRDTSFGARLYADGFAEIADSETGLQRSAVTQMRARGVRSLVSVLLKVGGETFGFLTVSRREPGRFAPAQVALLRAFADQAAIAIENARLFNALKTKTEDLSEALKQQTATAEMLKVISRSAFDLQAVFDTLIASAVELIGAFNGTICLREADEFRYRANSGMQSEFASILAANPPKPGRNSIAGRVLLSGRVESVPDALEDPDYALPAHSVNRTRSILGVPLLRDNKVEGVLVLARIEPGPFTERQIELVQTFADQAVIAIENARLFDEVQTRTRDLSKALKQQTATADVLKVISRSAFDLQTVFDTLINSAVELMGAHNGTICVREGDVYRYRASSGVEGDWAKILAANPPTPGRGSATGRVLLTGQIHSIADVLEDPEYVLPIFEANKTRSVLGVPLLRDDVVQGCLLLARLEPGPFEPRQIELVRTFADQAVIAIENARLFDEVQARTRDLEESLAQQTATADVLKVISRSAFDLQTVLDTLTVSAAKLCDGEMSIIFQRRGDLVHYVSNFGCSDEFVVYARANPVPANGAGSAIQRAVRDGRTVHIHDVLADPEYMHVGHQSRGGFRTMLAVPLLSEGEPIGGFSIGRHDVRPFNQRQIELVETFADQAVIAIENTRLFDEVQARTRDLSEALRMQTATSDVLKVISRSAFDLQAVFNTLVSSAVALAGAQTGLICVRDGDVYRYRDTAGQEPTTALMTYLRDHPATPGRSTIAGRVLLSGKVERIPDCLVDPEYVVPMGALASNVRSLIGVPLIRKDGVEGAIILTREQPGDFSDREVEIVRTFADQAVIAIENSQLLEQVQARTRELAASLDTLRKAQDRLVQSEKLASLGQLTAGIAHEIKNPLNFVNNFSALSRELLDEVGELLAKAKLADAERQEIEDLIGMVTSNLDKVVTHGKRADSIVKNMLLHSREGSGTLTSVNVNAMVEEAMNLAYHGARAEKPDFKVTLEKALDPGAGQAELYPQEMTRVLLNLISNGFYATAKRRLSEGDSTYEPTVTATTRDLGDRIEIAIRDNGTGIPDDVKAKIFNPFFTTKPAGEGTGLGLSLSHDIVVKQHGGTLEVATQPGVYTEFAIVLPRLGRASAA